jgi:hypothetical protein
VPDARPFAPDPLPAPQRGFGNVVPAEVVQRSSSASEVGRGHPPAARGFTVRDVLRGPGRPLAEPIRAEMEERLAADFSDVRVHTGAAAQASARDIDAHAYTSGSHIVFQQGHDDASAAGKTTLAHELAHVIQQRQGAVSGTAAGDGLTVSDPRDDFERAADATARRVMALPVAGLPAGVRAPAAAVGRSQPADHATSAIQRLMANVSWDRTPAPAGPKVNDAATERGSGTAGGAHSTAHTVFEWAAINAVRHKNFADGVAALLALVDGVKDLPGYQYADATEKKFLDTEITRIKGLPDNASPATVPAVEHTQVLQDLMVDYMKLRDWIPGSYVSGKSGTKGINEKDEKKGAKAMREAWQTILAGGQDPGGKATKLFAHGMNLTFDNDILPEVANLGPGAWGSALGQHIITVFQAFPGIPEAKQKAIQKVFLSLIFNDEGLGPRKWDGFAYLVASHTGVGFSGF